MITVAVLIFSPPCLVEEGVPNPSPSEPSSIAGAVQDNDTLKPEAEPVRSVGPATSGGAEGVAHASLEGAVSNVPSTCVTK